MIDIRHNSEICFILLPGFSPDYLPVLPLKEALKNRGYISVASTFFGNRDFKYFSELTLDQCHDHVSQLIQNVKKQYKQVIGIGISLGGAMLLEYAKTHNDLDGIVSIGTPFRLKFRKLMSLGEFLLPIVYPLWKKFEKHEKWRPLPIGAGSQVIYYLENRFLENLEKITTPVLLIHSKKDLVTDFRTLPEYLGKIGSMSKNAIITENGNHVIDHDPDKLINHAIAFHKL